MSEEMNADPDSRLVYVLLRYETGLNQAEFAELTRTSPGQVSLYESGGRPIPEAILERAAEAVGFPVHLLGAARRAVRSFRAAVRGWSRADRAFAEPFAAGLLACTGEALEAILPPTRQPAPPAIDPQEDREAAAGLWQRLEGRGPGERRAIVEAHEAYCTWAMCELVSARSVEAAPGSPSEALELAELAVLLARRCSGEEWLRQRAQGYAWFHVANARRAASDLPGSVGALDLASGHWEAGAAFDPGLFNESIVLALEANIRKAQRRFPEALERIGQALAADRGELKGKLLLTKAQILQSLGNVEASTEALREAVSSTDEAREPRTALGVRCQLIGNLCLQGRASEAAPHLPAIESLAAELAQEVDSVRVGFLGGVIAAGVGRKEEAEAAFAEARRRFASFEPPLAFDYALVSLDLGLLLLEQDRTAEVRELAEEMAWIFTSQGVQRETLAALKLFCDAAEHDAATVDMARRVIRFLHQAQHDPELRFEEVGST
jgi:tetratricopeptide (TPR) repeat protein